MLHGAPKNLQNFMRCSFSVQLVINEISSSAPQALQAIKLLAQYQGNKLSKVWPPLAIKWHGWCKHSIIARASPQGPPDSALMPSASFYTMQEDVLATIKDWLADPAVAHNASVLLVAGIIYTTEGDYVEALKALHGGELLEMWGLSTLSPHLDILTAPL